MCGIAGIFHFDGEPLDPLRVLSMAEVQAHRGPDGEGVAFFGGAHPPRRLDRLEAAEAVAAGQGSTGALAHRRLAVIDISERGAQPMADGDETLWVTFNGEIYNYVELWDELKSKGHVFRSASDTEVILAAYREWGVDCVERFNGMFAFALWDTGRRRLFCARDRLGIKPFYYLTNGGRFLFASEPKGILAALDERPSPHVPAMADYLCFSYVTTTETMFQGIHRLSPGGRLIASEHGVKQDSYWEPSFDPDPGPSGSTGVEELRSLLRDSIRLQVRSDVPIGAHLSGGMDSSLVCSLAAQEVDQLQTFSARFDEGPEYDESPYARLVAKSIGSRHRELTPLVGRLTDRLPRILYHLDEPVEGAAVYGKYHVAESVSSAVKVVLTGHGGDELFGGYDWYIKNLFTAACFGARRALGDHRTASFLWRTLTREEKPQRLALSLMKNFGTRDIDRICFRNWSRVSPSRVARLLRSEPLEGQPGPEERFLSAFRALPEQRAGDRMFRFDSGHYLEALLTSEDRLSMAFSVESRVPLLDHRIAEYAGRLGFERKTEPGRSKPMLRRAAEELIPAEILARRDKRGFPTPVAAWLLDPELKLFDSLVFSGNPFAARYFDLGQVRRLLTSPLRFGSDWAEGLWRVLNLCIWGQVFDLEK